MDGITRGVPVRDVIDRREVEDHELFAAPAKARERRGERPSLALFLGAGGGLVGDDRGGAGRQLVEGAVGEDGGGAAVGGELAEDRRQRLRAVKEVAREREDRA